MVEKTKENKFGKEEIYSKIEEMSKKATPAALIGLELKKNNIKNTKKTIGKRITQIQTELKVISSDKLPDDLMALIKKAVTLLKHQDINKKDTSAKRGYQLTVSKINRLKKYYIKEGKIPQNWRYSKETAKLLIK
ncbi:MAG: 30S ribosomal protein S15 [Candidatus ainarchaeum sp.]|nr:30S ribosomal protein S15 [Candidatus ainarchaeum sp.]MDD3976338.1 30S ribosomal protein S15 [Candidatus ainarchaeum sp.]